VTNSSGSATSINSYDEYGLPSSGNAGRFQYTGQAWIEAAGLYYYKSRFYSPELGRFLQPDTIGYAAGLNLYGYVSHDPVNKADPFGATDAPPPPPPSADEVMEEIVTKGQRGSGPTNYCGYNPAGCAAHKQGIRDSMLAYAMSSIRYSISAMMGFSQHAFSGAEGGDQEAGSSKKTLCDAMTEIASTASSNALLNGTRFSRDQLGGEVVPSGGGPIDNSHFNDSRSGLAYDVQWIQVGWSLTRSSARGLPEQVGAMYTVFGAGISAIINLDISYFRNGNVGANMRGLQLGEFGAGSFESFESFVNDLCPSTSN
jgi:RHS repeat-associated protein